ncbi:hypothetical protein JHK82_018530 [Glycine max]|uniref:Uncharacterized protein n=1 Tax=Glycine soja TaxID=3848 RepID=A0A0B2P6A7_GLYSO|nr:hypothetical protein JHK85_018961 [Glycine max]KAG5037719.1 hypothetical protein JHK86_018559 [Glycine max]KAG5142835.1 hypothetical protein JHK82_018530 [Glycine max]KHN03129.1 hypothetical protein glysoja_048053 [Glycine soja]
MLLVLANYLSFSGLIPASIGNLSKLNWLDIGDNQLQGPIHILSGSTPLMLPTGRSDPEWKKAWNALISWVQRIDGAMNHP